jgi:hypothetical protein
MNEAKPSAGELASFGYSRKPMWILKFEDADRGEMHFDNELDAHRSFEDFAVTWNCTLFETAPRKYDLKCGELVPLHSTPPVAGADAGARDQVEPGELEAVIADMSANRAADAILKDFVVTRRAALASPSVTQVEREKLAATIHKARFPLDRVATSFEDENSHGRAYCYRIADAILAISAEQPLATAEREALRHAEVRFQCLADHFREIGDETLWAMSEVDAERMGKALAEQPRSDPAQRPGYIPSESDLVACPKCRSQKQLTVPLSLHPRDVERRFIAAIYALNDLDDAQGTVSRDEFEIVRAASRMFQEASEAWMERALKAEAALSLPSTERVPIRITEWRDHAEKLDEYIRKDGSQYSLALAAIIEILENVEAAIAHPQTERG